MLKKKNLLALKRVIYLLMQCERNYSLEEGYSFK